MGIDKGEEGKPRHEQTWRAGGDDPQRSAREWEEEDQDEDWDYDDEESDIHPVRRILAYGVLLVVLAGGLWQSGAWTWVTRAVSSAPSASAPAVIETVVVEQVGWSGAPISAAVPLPSQPPAEVLPDPTESAPRVVIFERPFSIRVASYTPGSRWATSTLQALRERGESAFFSPVQVRGERYNRLLVGRWECWEQAYTHARRLQADGALEEFTILRLPYVIADIDASDSRWSDYTSNGSDRLAGAFETLEEAALLFPVEGQVLGICADN